MRIGFLCLITFAAQAVSGEEVAAAVASSNPVPTPQCGALETELKSARVKAEECLKSKESDLAVKNQMVAEKDTVIATKTNELTVKQQGMERLMTDIAQYKKVLGEWQQRSADLEKQISVLSVASEKGSELEKQLSDVRRQSEQAQEQLKRQHEQVSGRLNEAETKLATHASSCQVQQDKLSSELRVKDEQAKSVSLENTNLKTQVSQLTREVDSFKAEMNKQSELLYSSAQFWKTYEDSRKIVRAFGVLTHQRLVRLLGPNTYELIKLQVSMLSRRTQQQVVELYKPIRTRAVSLYDEKLRETVDPMLETAKVHGANLMVQGQDLGRKGLVLVEQRMEHFIRNLSTVDPTVRDLFPVEFHERCYAFAFASLLIYHATHILGWFWSTLITTPLGFLFGRGGKRKSRRGSSRRAAGAKGTKVSSKGGVEAADGKKESDTKKGGEAADGKKESDTKKEEEESLLKHSGDVASTKASSMAGGKAVKTSRK